MSKVRGNGFSHEQDVTGNLITGYMASGAKLTGLYCRRLYGTREAAIILRNGQQEASMQGRHEIAVAD